MEVSGGRSSNFGQPKGSKSMLGTHHEINHLRSIIPPLKLIRGRSGVLHVTFVQSQNVDLDLLDQMARFARVQMVWESVDVFRIVMSGAMVFGGHIGPRDGRPVMDGSRMMSSPITPSQFTMNKLTTTFS